MKFNRLDLFIVLALCGSVQAYGQQFKINAPNILFFLVDDMGWSDLGYSGSKFYETPHIDQLALEGRVFTRNYAAAPVCSPTRASLMTGKFPVRTGVTDYIGAPQQNEWKRNTQLLPANYADHLALEEVTLAEALKAGGYTTYIAGKWHLGSEGYWPENQGFDYNKGGVEKGNPGKGYFSPYNNARLPDGPLGEYLPERLATETSTFIKGQKHRHKPFFIYHAFYLVHTPLLPKPELLTKYKQKRDSLGLKDETTDIGVDVYDSTKMRPVRTNHSLPEYAAMVEALDQAVGKIIGTLKDEGLYEKTLIIFTSDNGGLSTSEGWPTSNEPLRGGKGWPYEGGIREPLIVRWPGITEAGSGSDEIVVSTDFYPTLLEAAGLPLRPEQHTDGISIVSALKGNPLPLRALYWHYPHYGNQGGAPYSAILNDDLKLIKFYERGVYYELYDLKDDPAEKNDLIHTYPAAKVSELKVALEHFLKEAKAQYPVTNPNYPKQVNE